MEFEEKKTNCLFVYKSITVNKIFSKLEQSLNSIPGASSVL